MAVEPTCYVTKGFGQYAFTADGRKEWAVQVRLPDGTWLSETWPEDEEPHIEGEAPSDVVEMISERLESYWLKTSREETRKKIAWCRENAEYLDALWAAREIKIIDQQIERLSKRRALLSSISQPSSYDEEQHSPAPVKEPVKKREGVK